MDQNRQLSGAAYGVESEKVKKDQIIKNTNHLVLDVVDTGKSVIGNEPKPKGNSMQAMTAAKIKNKYQDLNIEDLKEIEGYPESVITKDIIISYVGTNGLQDMKTDVREIGLNDKNDDGAFQSALDYANAIE